MNKTALDILPHVLSRPKVLEVLNSNVEKGLSEQEVIARHDLYGRNLLPKGTRRSTLSIFLVQFKSMIVLVLAVAALISYIYDHKLDTYIILGIVLVNAIVGFVQEFQAEKSIQALKKLMVPKATVRREGKTLTVSSHELVPGDIICCEEGDHVPADARILECSVLQTDESMLTGESMPVTKQTHRLEEKTDVAERTNMIWMGSMVVSGKCEAVVVSIGLKTMLGGIAGNLTSIEEHDDHFKVKTNELGKQMGVLAIVSTFLIFLVGFFVRDFGFEEIFIFSLASLVSAMPEGLPVILTLILAMSAKRMAKRHAIVRRLSATETLAVVDTIVTDKTGTLTQNKMSVVAMALPYQKPIKIAHTKGETSFTQGETTPTNKHFPLQKMIDIAGACHNVRRELAPDGVENFTGDPTEVALVTLADRANGSVSYLRREIKRLEDLPFNQEKRWRASLVVYEKSQKHQIFVVGSPESVVGACASILMPDHKHHGFTDEHRAHINEQVEALTKQGMRVLTLAFKPVADTKSVAQEDIHALVLAGFVGIIDPPRPETKTAVQAAKNAGIRVIMATGDHPTTARAIGMELGIIDKGEDRVITQTELDTLSDADLIAALDTTRVFARMTPSAKLRLAKIMQGQGRVVAMTGDGVNDAPALKQADIGIGMGKNGTDVAREASDIILTDDNFATIVAAVEEGRTQFRNVRRTSFFYITTNLAETFTLVLFLLVGLPIPFLPKQILWLNLVSGGITDIALATEPMHDDVLKTPPKKRGEAILNREVLPFLAIITGFMIFLAFTFFLGYQSQGLEKARTVLFVVMSACQVYHLYNMRSLKLSIFRVGILTGRNVNIAFIVSILMMLLVIYTPGVNTLFAFEPLPLYDLALSMLVPLLVVAASEGYKRYKSFHSTATLQALTA